MRLLALPLAMIGLAVASLAGAAGATPAPALGEAPANLPQTWIASFQLNGHVFRPGETITATVKVTTPKCFVDEGQCVSAVSWNVPGNVVSGCKPTVPPGTPTLRCSWKAALTEGWQVVGASFTNPTGNSAVSQDFYAVPGKLALDGTVRHPKTGRGIPGVTVKIGGKASYTATTNGSGYYHALLAPGSYTVRPTPPDRRSRFVPRRSDVRLGAKSVTRDFRFDREHDYRFEMANHDGRVEGRAVVGTDVSYIGNDWDPYGSAITVSAGETKLADYQPSEAKWGAAYRVPPFPDGRCVASLVARQDDIVRKAMLKGDRAVFVAAADKLKVQGGRSLASRSYMCEGEQPEIDPQGAAIYFAIDDMAAGFSGFRIDNRQGDVAVSGGLFAPRVQTALSGGRVATASLSAAIDPTRFDPAGKSNVQMLGPAGDRMILTGFARRDGDLRATGGLRLDGAVVYVNGNVTIEGGLNGTGALIATGSIVVRGSVSLTPESQFSILAGRPVVLAGR